MPKDQDPAQRDGKSLSLRRSSRNLEDNAGRDTERAAYPRSTTNFISLQQIDSLIEAGADVATALTLYGTKFRSASAWIRRLANRVHIILSVLAEICTYLTDNDSDRSQKNVSISDRLYDTLKECGAVFTAICRRFCQGAYNLDLPMAVVILHGDISMKEAEVEFLRATLQLQCLLLHVRARFHGGGRPPPEVRDSISEIQVDVDAWEAEVRRLRLNNPPSTPPLSQSANAEGQRQLLPTLVKLRKALEAGKNPTELFIGSPPPSLQHRSQSPPAARLSRAKSNSRDRLSAQPLPPRPTQGTVTQPKDRAGEPKPKISRMFSAPKRPYPSPPPKQPNTSQPKNRVLGPVSDSFQGPPGPPPLPGLMNLSFNGLPQVFSLGPQLPEHRLTMTGANQPIPAQSPFNPPDESWRHAMVQPTTLSNVPLAHPVTPYPTAQGSYTPVYSMWTFEKANDPSILAKYNTTRPSWKVYRKANIPMSSQDIQHELRNQQASNAAENRSLVDVWESIPSTAMRRAVENLISEQDNLIQQHNLRLQWKIAGLQILWQSLHRSQRQANGMTVILRTDLRMPPHSHTCQCPVCTRSRSNMPLPPPFIDYIAPLNQPYAAQMQQKNQEELRMFNPFTSAESMKFSPPSPLPPPNGSGKQQPRQHTIRDAAQEDERRKDLAPKAFGPSGGHLRRMEEDAARYLRRIQQERENAARAQQPTSTVNARQKESLRRNTSSSQVPLPQPQPQACPETIVRRHNTVPAPRLGWSLPLPSSRALQAAGIQRPNLHNAITREKDLGPAESSSEEEWDSIDDAVEPPGRGHQRIFPRYIASASHRRWSGYSSSDVATISDSEDGEWPTNKASELRIRNTKSKSTTALDMPTTTYHSAFDAGPLTLPARFPPAPSSTSDQTQVSIPIRTSPTLPCVTLPHPDADLQPISENGPPTSTESLSASARDRLVDSLLAQWDPVIEDSGKGRDEGKGDNGSKGKGKERADKSLHATVESGSDEGG